MALIKIDSIAPLPLAAPSVAPPGPADQVRSRISEVREWIELFREFRGLSNEIKPLLEMFRPPEPEGQGARLPRAEYEAPLVPEAGARLPVVRPGKAEPEAPPGPSERETAALEEIRALVRDRLTKPLIIEAASELGPFAVAEKCLKTAEILAKRQPEISACLTAFDEAELKDIIMEFAEAQTPRSWPILKQMLGKIGPPDAAPSAPTGSDGGAAS